MLGETFAQDCKDFIEAFMDDEKLRQTYISQERSNQGLTKVRELNGDQFMQEFVKNPNFEHCLLELKKKDCPACFYMGKLIDVISLKMDKHVYLKTSNSKKGENGK